MRRRDHLWQALRPQIRLLAALVFTGLLLTATEGIGLGLVFLLLGSPTKSGAIAGRRWLSVFGHELQRLSVRDHIRIAAVALVALTLLRCLFQYAQSLQTLRLRRAVERDLQLRVFRRFHELALTFLQREHQGSLLVMLNQHPQRIGAMALRLGRSTASMILIVAYVALALAVSLRLTAACVILLLLVALFFRPWVSARVRGASRQSRDLLNEVNNVSGEHLPAMKLIRAFDRRAWSETCYAGKLDAAYGFEYRAGALAGMSGPLYSLLNALVLAVILLASAALLQGTPQAIAAELGVFLVIAFRLMGPVGILADFQTELLEAGPVLDAVFEFLEPIPRESKAPSSGSRPFARMRNGVELENIHFRYGTSDAPALQGLSLTIPKGTVTAVVGASGSGKSTAAALIARLYDPADGRILVDGQDLRDLEIGSWRRRVALAGQDLPLFHASVRENLLFANPRATDREIVEACRMAQAHDFVAALPEGYETILQDRGKRLSAGQRQRIVLARALLADADLLILDEATSDLDVIAESAIHDTLASCRMGRTVLIIAHRLSTIRDADRIYVFDAGRVAETGTHEDLLAAGGIYSRMIHAGERGHAGDLEPKLT